MTPCAVRGTTAAARWTAGVNADRSLETLAATYWRALLYPQANSKQNCSHLPVSMNNLDQEISIGWGTLALLNAGLAQSKSRNGLNWFLLSLLLGPLATLLLITAFRHPPKVTGR